MKLFCVLMVIYCWSVDFEAVLADGLVSDIVI